MARVRPPKPPKPDKAELHNLLGSIVSSVMADPSHANAGANAAKLHAMGIDPGIITQFIAAIIAKDWPTIIALTMQIILSLIKPKPKPVPTP